MSRFYGLHFRKGERKNSTSTDDYPLLCGLETNLNNLYCLLALLKFIKILANIATKKACLLRMFVNDLYVVCTGEN